MRWIVLVHIISFYNNVEAQNLVVNSTFDKYYSCQKEAAPNDTNFCRTMAPLPFYCTDWYFPFFSTADYYNLNCLPQSGLEYIWELIPKETDFAFIGFNLFGPDGNFEPITGTISNALIRDESYVVSFKMCFLKTISQWYSKKIEIKFSSDLQVYPKPIYSNTNYVDLFRFDPVMADIEIDISELSDSVYWKSFQYYYKARGDEKYITFGIFYQDKYDLTLFCQEFARYCHERKIIHWLRKNKETPVLVFQGEKSNFLNQTPQQKRIVYYLLDDVKIERINHPPSERSMLNN